MSMYEHVESQRGGARRLAAGRLRYAALKTLHAALEESKLNQSELAAKLGIRKSAVNQVFRGDGNVRMNTLAEYLHELGFEARIDVAPAGDARSKSLHFEPIPDREWTTVGAPIVQESLSVVAPSFLARNHFTVAA